MMIMYTKISGNEILLKKFSCAENDATNCNDDTLTYTPVPSVAHCAVTCHTDCVGIAVRTSGHVTECAHLRDIAEMPATTNCR